MSKRQFSQKWITAIVTVGVICSTQVSNAAKPADKYLSLTNPYWRAGRIEYNQAGFDTAGYSDKFWWGLSPRHPYSEHEMLSGEWGAAIYYDGIATAPEAMWLTDKFFFPDWTTNSQFIIDSDPVSSDNVNNPVVGLDTGYSRIKNAQVEITIDYEMVDLGDQEANGEGGSSLSFGSLVGADAFVYSERYVLLQTYTITNITASSIQNLKFYQMLHGHPADEGTAVVYSVYDDTDHPDPLEEYDPWNDVHCEEGSTFAGKFRYDITQWNNSDDPARSVSHRDWIGFSSTVPPDFFENGYYEGHDAGKPPWNPDRPGTHWNIESKTLNEQSYSFGEAAGAMGWSLGTLAPDDSVKLTLAIMFGAGPIQKTCEQIEPVAHWGLDEGLNDEPGTTAHDYIGDNDGAFVGDPQWVVGEYIGGALEFGGSGYVALSDPVGALTGDSVTVSAWVKPGANMGTVEIYDIFSQTKTKAYPHSVAGYSLYLETGEDEHGACGVGFRLNYPGVHASSSDEIEKGEWAWVVGTNDGTNLKVYVNGDLKATDDSTGRMGVYADAYIGYLPDVDPFIGVIDCVRVFACAWDPSQDCLLACHQDYDEWFEAGRPDCWCTPYQCDGDAAVDVHSRGYRVFTTDLTILSDSWKKQPGDPGFSPCADFNHQQDHVRGYRVYTEDLQILSDNWKRKDFPDLPGDCAVRGCGEGARGSGTSEQVTSKELLDWLAEIWLDPEVREGIDAKAWLRLYQSLKE